MGHGQDDSPNDQFELDPLMVTASPAPRNASDYTTLADSIGTETVATQPAGNLGQLLESRPGVYTSGFAPGAGRPIIRGFSGPRVRILEDGLSVLDVSAASDDHAVGSEPFLASSIEVLRGPATLLYGGNAIGGVVNIVTGTAPAAPLSSPAEGRLFTRYEDGNDGWTGGGVVATGTGKWALRMGALVQRHNDYRVPGGFDPPHPEHEEEAHHDHEHEHEHGEASVLENSFSDRETLQMGVSRSLDGGGRLSVFGTRLESLYGVPGHAHAESHADEHGADHGEEEAHVRIDLRSRRAGFVMDTPLNGLLFERTQLDFAYTDYEHRELEGENVGTTFSRESLELRSEWGHRAILGNTGIIGAHIVASDFRAEGAEAFTPPSETVQAALFWLGEHANGALSLRNGLRLEWQETTPDTAVGKYEGLAMSASSGLRWPLASNDSIGIQMSISQRHPSESELFAEGPHLATGRFEIGDPGLDVETALGLDLTYRLRRDPVEFMVAGYLYRFDNYIHEAPTGATRDALPVYQYRQEDALITGMEAELTVHLFDRKRERLHLVLSGDWTRLEALESDELLPRNPPARVRAGLFYELGIVSAEMGVSRIFAQDSIAVFETPTDGHTLVDLRLSAEFNVNGRSAMIFVEANNLTDELGFNHLSYRKETKPLPGRSVSTGVLVRF